MKIFSAPNNTPQYLPKLPPPTYLEPEPGQASWLDEYTFIPETAATGAVTGLLFSTVAYNMASSSPVAAAALGALSGAGLSVCTGDSIPNLRTALRRMGTGALLGAGVLAAGGLGPTGILLSGAAMGLLAGLGRADSARPVAH
ncbi:hypothetical protein IV102_26005 [bacterium]|nr:hypothetical protein [bacterium]